MKFRLIIDKNAEEEIVARVHATSRLTEEIENLVNSYIGKRGIAVSDEDRLFADAGMWPFAFNEFTVHRTGSSILGVDVSVNGTPLPTYWADGLILSTSAGSTAYSLSVGGPIVMPGAKALIITPIASHNLNIRPLIVPDTSIVRFTVHSRDGKAIFTADNRSVEIPDGTTVTMSMAQFSLKRVRLNSSNFINALTEKLFWGEDIRNNR